MSQYLISVWHDDPYDIDVDSPDAKRRFAQVGAFNTELQQAGAWVFANGLYPAETATTLRVANGEVSMTAGPYAKAKAQMGGFWIIDVADLDAALDWAKRAAVACEETLEVRAFHGD